jgi:hypothetical protein
MRYLIYDIDKHQEDCQLTEMPKKADFENADDCTTVIVDLQEGQRYYCREWKPCTVNRTFGNEPVRGWLEKGTTWQERALNAEHRLAQAYERMRNLDEEITKLKMELAENEEYHKTQAIHQAQCNP